MRKLLAMLATAFLTGCAVAYAPPRPAFEVWAVDQNGNTLYVLDRDGNVIRTLDSTALGSARRPHMLWSVPGDPYVYSTNTVSNSVTVLDRAGRVVTLIANVGKLPHAAQPHPARPNHLYVMNIAPQATADGVADRGETITELIRDGSGEWRTTRRIDLRADAALADSAEFPSRRPVCAGFSPDGRTMLVTLFNGGLAAVDLDAGWVARAWGRSRVAGHGCGFAASPDGRELYVTAGDMRSSWLYVFDVSGAVPMLARSHNLSATGQDAHGVYIDPTRSELWVAHRVSSNVTIHPLATIRSADHAFETIPFAGRTPDLIAFSPDASRAYITLRGPNPAPTIPHATVGETPGVAILDVASRRLLNVVRLGNQQEADFHGIFVP